MSIVKLLAHTFPVPFNVVFRHSSATRKHTENFVVSATTNSSIVGFGEGCPRSYVTGESVNSCLEFLDEHRDSLLDGVNDVATLNNWIQQHRSSIDQSPSAFCAIELAILDAFGQRDGLFLESLLGINGIKDTVRYTGVLGDAPFLAYWLLAKRYKRNGFRDFKIKLSGNAKKDQRKLAQWEKPKQAIWRVRLDANNLWRSSEDCLAHLKLLPAVFWGMEEPLQARDFVGMHQVANELKCKVILELSCTSIDDLDTILGESWACNLRVSKIGGLIRSIELADAARRKGIQAIVGAHVGETSLLSRAALALIQYLNNAQLAVEGAFGRHLLKEDLTEEVIEFDANSSIVLEELPALSRPGLGLKVTASKLIALDA